MNINAKTVSTYLHFVSQFGQVAQERSVQVAEKAIRRELFRGLVQATTKIRAIQNLHLDEADNHAGRQNAFHKAKQFAIYFNRNTYPQGYSERAN